MVKTAFAGLLLCAMIFMADSPNVSASQHDIVSSETTAAQFSELALKEVTEVKDEPVEKPQPVKHVVKENQTLTDIAEQHDTTWKRLYDKNTEIKDPDVLSVGEKLIVPGPEEELEERPLPETPASEETIVSESSTGGTGPSTSTYRGSSSGNGYVRGYCTWYAKQKRPDLPNNLGNADTWVSRARAQGLPTGSAARVGAIGQQGMHVVYVESVHGDGTVTVSEMNWEGWNIVSSRRVAASNFMYIY